jgi:DegV family protein with EDD domain
MMQKVTVVTDSLACLTRELVKKYGIKIVPLNIHVDGKIYKDWVDITPKQAYELFLKAPEAWGTSAPSPGEYLKVFRKVGKRIKNILCVTASARVSATIDAARLARRQAKAEFPRISIEVFDSQMATAAEGLVALAAAKAAKAGKSLPEVAKIAEEVRGKVSFLAFLDTIRYVYRSGRIPKIAAQAGSLLNIKPILTMSSGVVRFMGAARSREGGIERMLKVMRDRVGQKPVHVAVMHAYALEEAQKLKERVASAFNCVEIWISEFSPLMGYATGTGTLGLAFYAENEHE